MSQPTNQQIARILDITSRSVQNKKNGWTAWTVPEYLILCKYYGTEIADEIIKREKLERQVRI